MQKFWNMQMLATLEKRRTLSQTVLKGQLHWFGHVIRMSGDAIINKMYQQLIK